MFFHPHQSRSCHHARHAEHFRGFDERDAGDSAFGFAGRGPFGRPGRGGFDGFDPRFAGGPRRGGRMFGHGDLKLLLLALIEQQPRHGYELIRIIEDMFHGQYSPSPGTVYPTLTMLQEMGHARVESEDGGRKLYAITDDGRAWLDEHRDTVEAVMAYTQRNARHAARMRAPSEVRRAMESVHKAMFLHGKEWTREEGERVSQILEQAARKIAGGAQDD